jgi:hypothetical protein
VVVRGGEEKVLEGVLRGTAPGRIGERLYLHSQVWYTWGGQGGQGSLGYSSISKVFCRSLEKGLEGFSTAGLPSNAAH